MTLLAHFQPFDDIRAVGEEYDSAARTAQGVDLALNGKGVVLVVPTFGRLHAFYVIVMQILRPIDAEASGS